VTLTTRQIHVGERLRQFRTDRGLSVRTSATKAGFSPSFISQAERGQVSPSIASLERIAAVLGITLGRFFTEPLPGPVAVVRTADRRELTSARSRARLEALGPTEGVRTRQPIMMTLAAGGRSGTRRHEARSEQFALVCDGEVTLADRMGKAVGWYTSGAIGLSGILPPSPVGLQVAADWCARVSTLGDSTLACEGRKSVTA
jgi:transcriptional regulator with XRE-family HTH domain